MSAPEMVFEDPRSITLRARLESVAANGAPVLVVGETGTGKERVAQEVHQRGARRGRPFVAVNAASLAEDQLLGTSGWFEAADGGTLFIDDVGDLPLPQQLELLRLLSTDEVTRLGSCAATRVDVRLIAATIVDLLGPARACRFSEELYQRFSASTLALLPLRERPGDILPLARRFLEHYALRIGRSGVRLGTAAALALLGHDWPGNVRELENTIHQGLLVCRRNELRASDFDLGPGELARHAPDAGARLFARLERALFELLPLGVPDLYARVESLLIAAAFEYSGRDELETTRLLGLRRLAAVPFRAGSTRRPASPRPARRRWTRT